MLGLLRDFGLDDYYLELSTRDDSRKDKFVGSDEDWAVATQVLEDVAKETGLEPCPTRGAAFYGPKISRAGAGRDRPHLADVDDPVRLQPAPWFRAGVPGGRRHAAAAGDDPLGEVRLDRAVLRRARRALRRRVPPWLAPVQVQAIPIAERHNDYLADVARQMRAQACASRSTTPTTGCRRRSATRSCRRCRSW